MKNLKSGKIAFFDINKPKQIYFSYEYFWSREMNASCWEMEFPWKKCLDKKINRFKFLIPGKIKIVKQRCIVTLRPIRPYYANTVTLVSSGTSHFCTAARVLLRGFCGELFCLPLSQTQCGVYIRQSQCGVQISGIVLSLSAPLKYHPGIVRIAESVCGWHGSVAIRRCRFLSSDCNCLSQ